jgi:integrase
MSDWEQAGENLVRYRGGTYYLRASIGGVIVRRSLKTASLRAAKTARDELLAELRGEDLPGANETLGRLLPILQAAMIQPRHKPGTATVYRTIIKTLRKTLPVTSLAGDFTPEQASDWWAGINKAYSPARANLILIAAHRLGKMIVERKMARTDPFARLVRVRVKRRALDAPSLAQVRAIIAAVADMPHTESGHAANMIAFLAFSGCRSREARAVEWDDVGPQWLTVTGGAAGTKSGLTRRVPISEPLRAAIEAMRGDDSSGRIFQREAPRKALHAACRKLNLPPLRIHDLRHFFATWAIESGVDIPTVSKWLGHQDGGALAMRVYGHLRDDHSLDSARKLQG